MYSIDLLNKRRQLSGRDFLISSSRQFGHRIPINVVEIKSNRDPALRPKISRHKETLRIVFDQSTLLTQARLARESDHAVAVMVKEVVGKYPLANAKCQVRLAGNLNLDLWKGLTDFDEARTSLRRCGELV